MNVESGVGNKQTIKGSWVCVEKYEIYILHAQRRVVCVCGGGGGGRGDLRQKGTEGNWVEGGGG